MSHFPVTNSITDNLYSVKVAKDLDQSAMSQMDIPGIVLMKRAGAAALSELLEAFGRPSLVTVFCGSGNNAGDGYIIAALASQKKIPVKVYELGNTKKFSKETAQARAFAEQSNVPMAAFDSSVELAEGVIVDSLLGIGYTGGLRESYAQAVRAINDAELPVLSVDLPTGLDADTGTVVTEAVNADITVTFICSKKGLFTGRGPALCGDIVYHSLDVSNAIFEGVQPAAQLLDSFSLLDALPQWNADVYKHQRGHSMIIGGDHGYGGAAALAAEASLKTGCGLTSVATQPQHVGAILARSPEAMVHGVTSGQQLEPLLERPNVLVIGPGLGRSPWSEQLLQKALKSGLPLVVDADALNIVAEGRLARNAQDRQWIMTPHPGEAARLLNTSVAEVQADRFAAARKIQEKYNALVLLKGPGTLIAGENEVIKICPYGNSAMATAGMGDLLSGIIGSLLAQGLSMQEAAELGCCLHSCAADLAVNEQGPRGLVSSDLLLYLHQLLNREY